MIEHEEKDGGEVASVTREVSGVKKGEKGEKNKNERLRK